jgi:hypothetical protein
MQLSDIVEYQNFFSPTDFLSITRSISNKPWYWGHVSHPKQSQGLPPFWQMPLNDDKFFTNYLLNKIEENTGVEYDLERVYANGQTYGMRGSIHQDGFDESCRTLLYYPVETWNPEWNGKTAFKLGSEYRYVVPEPNKAVIFPGAIPHWAEETSRTFAGLRITIAWKLFIKVK